MCVRDLSDIRVTDARGDGLEGRRGRGEIERDASNACL